MRVVQNPPTVTQTSAPPTLGATTSGGSLIQATGFGVRALNPHFTQQPGPAKLTPQHEALYSFLGKLGITDPPVTVQTTLTASASDDLAQAVKSLSEQFFRPKTPHCTTIQMDKECGNLIPALLSSERVLTRNDIQEFYVRGPGSTSSLDHPRSTGQAYTPHGQDKGRRVNHPGPTRGGHPESRTVSPLTITRTYPKGSGAVPFNFISSIGMQAGGAAYEFLSILIVS